MNETAPLPEENFFSFEVLLNQKEFQLILDIQGDSLIISISRISQDNKIVYKKSYTIESLQEHHKFFYQYENLTEVLSAIKNVLTTGSYELERNEKEINLIIYCFGKQIKLTIPETLEQTPTDTSDILINSDVNSLDKAQIEEANKKYLEVKKQNNQLLKEINQLRQFNKELLQENQKLQERVLNLKELGVIQEKLDNLLLNNLRTKEDKLNEKVFRNFEGKLKGDLLNENTIAFNKLSKAYLWYWIYNNGRPINTVLLYKGSRDGDSAKTFHERCNNKGPTLTLVKSTLNYHFGGFNPNSWKTDTYYTTGFGSFLFTLDKNLKYPLRKGFFPGRYFSSYGPVFGCRDLYIEDNCMNNEKSFSNGPYSYFITDVFTGAHKFKVSEIEVYQIIYE